MYKKVVKPVHMYPSNQSLSVFASPLMAIPLVEGKTTNHNDGSSPSSLNWARAILLLNIRWIVHALLLQWEFSTRFRETCAGQFLSSLFVLKSPSYCAFLSVRSWLICFLLCLFCLWAAKRSRFRLRGSPVNPLPPPPRLPGIADICLDIDAAAAHCIHIDATRRRQ